MPELGAACKQQGSRQATGSRFKQSPRQRFRSAPLGASRGLRRRVRAVKNVEVRISRNRDCISSARLCDLDVPSSLGGFQLWDVGELKKVGYDLKRVGDVWEEACGSSEKASGSGSSGTAAGIIRFEC
jgi:hypothetical protein